MMTQDRDYEDALRRALAAAAESIEPAGDGLQRIRHRLDSPRSPRSVISGCAEWLERHGTRFLVRLEPATEAGRSALRRSGPLLALARFLRGLLGPREGGAGGHRGTAGSPGRLGPAGAWLKPVLAVSAAVAIVVVGVVILNHEGQTLIGPSSSVSTSSPVAPGTAGRQRTPSGGSCPSGSRPSRRPPARPRTGRAGALPVVACTPTPAPSPTSATASPGMTPTPTPTASGTVTVAPTPSPTETEWRHPPRRRVPPGRHCHRDHDGHSPAG